MNKSTWRGWTAIASIAAAMGMGVGLGVLIAAGPLNPPAGVVAGTYKTLTEVEPRIAISLANTPGDADSLFKITQPGSYYLTGNITGVAGKHGIEIVASGVMLDLNGFGLTGVPGVGLFNGVDVSIAGLTNITIVNGTVHNWSQNGVHLVGLIGPVTNCRIEGVQATGNIQIGILGSDNSVISRCSASGGQIGIYAGSGSTVSECTATGCSNEGVFAATGSTITNCSAHDNAGSGFETSDACTVTNCSASSNGGIGISTNNASTVANCTVWASTLDGIRCSASCVIRDNTCAGNGAIPGDGANIHARFAGNRIEGNNCIGADRGIDVDVAGNIIIRNACSSNGVNWDIVAGNAYGPIELTPAGAAVLGDTAAAALGNTHPNANFTY
ncbi:MAG: right-handed parallel beta-helix repeat-containing protein [Planctomycetota bacterium]